ncbi:hypothetical protein GCM10023231_20010 [Olivibacter ginsenosidimutans]|uniref:Alpha/beta hydrolase n=2 Tax=Olivibacter ginsenosidimutans TaxID=1176537 RepID=A0ABP9B8B9_9SPHI
MGQVTLSGRVVDQETGKPLAYVNIGIRNRNVGTVSTKNGQYHLAIAAAHDTDTLTFSLVGYAAVTVPIARLNDAGSEIIKLHKKTVSLPVVAISANKLVERKFGIKRRNLLVHFTDGMFNQEDIFEIGQLINIGNRATRIQSLNLYINSARADSATFRINFYRYDGKKPAERVLERSIVQRRAIQSGWLRFEWRDPVIIKGNFIAAVEFIPENKKAVPNISYEVKLGGSSKSFYRRNSQGQWNTPPHHYCLYVTALVDPSVKEEADDLEAMPAFRLYADAIRDSFSIFVQLPKEYVKHPDRHYPVIYQLDGNAYADQVNQIARQWKRSSKKENKLEPIVVSVGYDNAYLMDSLRIRDYTFPKAPLKDSLPLSGGGDRFYTFVTSTLIPHIDRVYRTDRTNRTLMGHSFGGYFVLYALFRAYQDDKTAPLFNHYVAASPSITYADSYLVKQFGTLAHQGIESINKPSTLFLTMGEKELDSYTDTCFHNLLDALKSLKKLAVSSKIYEQIEHMGTAIPSFEDGLTITGDMNK